MEITFKLSVVITQHGEEAPPDFGMGVGVLGTQYIKFKNITDYKSPMLLASLLDAEGILVADLVECQMEISIDGDPGEPIEEAMEYFTKAEGSTS